MYIPPIAAFTAEHAAFSNVDVVKRPFKSTFITGLFEAYEYLCNVSGIYMFPFSGSIDVNLFVNGSYSLAPAFQNPVPSS